MRKYITTVLMLVAIESVAQEIQPIPSSSAEPSQNSLPQKTPILSDGSKTHSSEVPKTDLVIQPQVSNNSQGGQSPSSTTATIGSSLKQFFAVSAGYSSAETGIARNATLRSGGATVTGEYKIRTTDAMVFGFEYGQYQIHGFGFDMGFHIDSERKVRGVDFSSKGITSSGSPSHDLNVFIKNLSLNGVYHFEEAYIRIGSNRSFPVVDDAAAVGTFGYQFGFGTFARKNLAVDLLYRRINFTASAIDGSATLDFGQIQFDGLTINLKYVF